MSKLFAKVDLASLALRLALAAIFISLGITRVYAGWGASWDINPVHFSAGLQGAIAWCELVAGVALLFGLLTRVAAFALLVIMIGSIWWLNFHPEFVHASQRRTQEFFSVAPALWTYSYAVAGMTLALLVLGGGLFSIDCLLWRKWIERRNIQGTAPVVAPTERGSWWLADVSSFFKPRRNQGMAR
jgi:uncharacterized membrane protein YphA (DoxX/SURF4 family)